MSDPLLSIVVPTRNRQELAMSLLRGFTAFPADRVELIIHDNSDDMSLQWLQAELGDARIRYIHVTEPLNMHGNCDRAIAAARGAFVTVIGDDDGVVVSEAIKAVELALELGADAIVTGVPGYLWPGTIARVQGPSRGRLFWKELDRTRPTLADPEEELRKLFAAGMVHSLGKLPRVYQGFVRKQSLDALFERCGTYLPGPSPDMANAVALVPFVNRILVTPRPALISGHSPRSGGGAGSAGKHHGVLEEQKHLPAGTVEAWRAVIPRFWSGPTIYAQSALVAREASGRPVPSVGYHNLYAACLVYESPRYWPLVGAALRSRSGGTVWLALRTAMRAAHLVAIRGWTYIGNLMDKRRSSTVETYPDIESVMHECERRVGAAATASQQPSIS